MPFWWPGAPPFSLPDRAPLRSRDARRSDPPAAAAAELVARLRHVDIEPVAVATVEQRTDAQKIRELASAVADAPDGTWLVVTSPTGARALLDALRGAERRSVRHRFAAVGPATAAVLEAAGVPVDLVPDHYNGRALGDALAGSPAQEPAQELAQEPAQEPAGRAVLAVSAIASTAVEDELHAAGWEVDRHDVYDTVPVRLSSDEARALADCDLLTFTSGSAARALAAHDATVEWPPCLCLGESTAATASDAGFEVVGVADPSTIDGLVAAVLRSAPRTR